LWNFGAPSNSKGAEKTMPAEKKKKPEKKGGTKKQHRPGKQQNAERKIKSPMMATLNQKTR